MSRTAPRMQNGPGAHSAKNRTEAANPTTSKQQKGHTMSTPKTTPATTAPAGFTPKYELVAREDGTAYTTEHVSYWAGPSMTSDQFNLEAAWIPEAGLHFLSDDGSIRTFAELRQLVADLTNYIASWDALTTQPETSPVAIYRRRQALLAAIARVDRYGQAGFVELYEAELHSLDQAAAAEGGAR